MKWVDRLAILGVAAITIALGLGMLGRLHWQLELLSHFAVQYVIALAALLAYFALRRRWRSLLLLVPILLIAGWRVAAYYISLDQDPIANSRRQIRVMSINVQVSNDRFDLVRKAITDADADVILLPEATIAWQQALSTLRDRYPFSAGDGQSSIFSSLLLSRFPLGKAKVIALGNPGIYAIAARVCPAADAGAADCLYLIGIHPPPPMMESLAIERNTAFRALSSQVRSVLPSRTIVLGDFNCTPWSPHFAELLSTTELRDSAVGFGAQPTWLSSSLLLGLKIDHILVGSALGVRSHLVGGYVGSDHYPVIADILY